MCVCVCGGGGGSEEMLLAIPGCPWKDYEEQRHQKRSLVLLGRVTRNNNVKRGSQSPLMDIS